MVFTKAKEEKKKKQKTHMQVCMAHVADLSALEFTSAGFKKK